MTYSLQL